VAETTPSRTILFADIAGSTLLYESAGDDVAHRKVAACLATLAKISAGKSGRVVKTIGDEILAVFDCVDHALLAACDMQLAFREWGHIRLRIGFHAGHVVDADGDVFGDAVNLAARVVELANPGQILMTSEAFDQLAAPLKHSCRELYSTSVRGRAAAVTLFEAVCVPDGELTVIMGGRSPADAHTGSRLVLTVVGTTREFGEDSAPATIGRGPANALVINLPTASRHHASIAVVKGKFVLTDTSSNGTYVQLANGDQYVLRREEFILGGAGSIGLGAPVDQCGDQVLRFELKR
jgi:adenylate cyclase